MVHVPTLGAYLFVNCCIKYQEEVKETNQHLNTILGSWKFFSEDELIASHSHEVYKIRRACYKVFMID